MSLNNGFCGLFRDIPAQELIANDRSEKRFSDDLFTKNIFIDKVHTILWPLIQSTHYTSNGSLTVDKARKFLGSQERNISNRVFPLLLPA